MSRTRLLLRTLIYHWRTNLAVLLGVVAGTAVVGGALVVGDSVRGSLRDMTLARLGRIDHALTGPRFVREALAAELAESPDFQQRFAAVAPAIVLPGTLEKPGPDSTKILARAGRIQIYGVDSRLWDLSENADVPPPQGDEILLSQNLARQLNVGPGDTVVLSVELPSDIPRDSLLGKRDETAAQIPLTMKAVLPESSGLGRLGLHPDQQLPSNAFVSLATLQDRLGLSAHRASRKDPRELPARINTLFAAMRDPSEGQVPAAPLAAQELTRLLGRAWKLEDIHVRIVTDAAIPCLSLESERMILERGVATGAEYVASSLRSRVSPVLAYIANEMSVVERADGGHAAPEAGQPAYSRYSIVAGIEPALFQSPDSAPFGPYVFAGDAPNRQLGEGEIDQPEGVGEIVLNDWLAADLSAAAGDTIRLTYHLVGSHGELPEVERRFVVRGIVRLEGTIASDRGLTPEVRGITDVDSFTEWDSPFPMEPVTPRDDAYWKRYRATPKAFVTLKTAQHLWQNRYGELTSIRVAAAPGQSLAETESQFTSQLLQLLQPEKMGLSFQPVKFQGLRAAAGTTDFGGLFFGFSFFLILSAAILIGLLFRLGIEKRTEQVGLLLATGFSHAQVRGLLLGEGLLVVMVGVALGLLAACGYASLMVYGLKTWWIGAIGTRFLEVHIVASSLAIGAVISTVVALGSIWWGLRSLWLVSPRSLLAGVTQSNLADGARSRRRDRARWIAIALAGFAVVSTIGVVAGLIPATEAIAGFSWPTIVFFLVGMALLAAGMSAFASWLDADAGMAVRGTGFFGVARLGLRNAARNRVRSLLSTGLIASATFLIVAIAAGHRNPSVERPERNSGNGGFTLIADSSAPVLFDLNTPKGRDKLGLDDDSQKDDATVAARASLGPVIGFRVKPGENASCLNIYQTSQPTILGVPPEMIDRGGFKFVGAGSENPWLRLREPSPDGVIPVFGDMNTLQYSLHVGPGQTLQMFDELRQPFEARIAGMLDSSVFQGVLLMDETHFRRLFPAQAGARMFLIDTPPEHATAVADWLESTLPGFDAERVADRLAGFLAVQNTYLSTFQALGGLGLLLGTIGLAAVMLRNVLDRRVELALLRAVGFRDGSLAWLVLCENAMLLAWGLGCGGGAALLAMLPHLVSIGADVPWRDLGIIVAGVFVVGMAASLAAVRDAVRTPVLATLRGE
jgi:ABC-type lipoprotein release transport system permease subunit